MEKVQRELNIYSNKKIALMILLVFVPLVFLYSVSRFENNNNAFDQIFNSIFTIFKKNNEEATPILVEDTTEEEITAFQYIKAPKYSDPVTLILKGETFEKEISIVEVGVAADGALEVPGEWNEAGWFKKSSKPGETGNMILDGHYDTNYGTPAAFWELKYLKIGDTLGILDNYGNLYEYKVYETFLVDLSDPDKLEVYEDSEMSAEVTLITCSGVWLPGESTYSKRLVIKGELIQ